MGESATPMLPVRPVAPADAETMPLEDGSEDIVLEEPAEEAASAPVLRDPGEPTQAEVDEHNLTHAAFRSWCPHCVRGRGRNVAHRAVHRDADALPTLSFDYCFLNSKTGNDDEEQLAAGMSPVIVMHDDISGGVFAHAVPHKGVDYEELPLVVRAVAKDIYSLGYKRVIFRDDQEPALVAFLRAVRRALMGEVVFENSPVGDPQGNGAAERGVQTVKDFSRTLRDALEFNLKGTAIAPECPAMSWLVTHAATVHRRYSVGADGRTAYQRNKGKPASSAIVEFGEKVFYKPLGAARDQSDARFEFGHFIGLSETSNEVILATEDGNVVKARCIRRLPKSQRWHGEWLQALKGTEIQPNPGEHDTRIRVRLDPKVASEVVVPAPQPKPPRTRSVRLTEADFWDAGFTDNCRGCELILEGSRQSRVHTVACRRRMEEHLSTTADGRRRLLAAEERKALKGAPASGDGPGGDDQHGSAPAPVAIDSSKPPAPIADSEDPDVAVTIPIENARNIPNADGSGQWIREDREARRFRTTASNGPEWKYVTRRLTVDMDTGEVLEDLHDVQKVARGALCKEVPGKVRNLRTTLYYVPPPSAGAAAGSAPMSSGAPRPAAAAAPPTPPSSSVAAAPSSTPPPPPSVDYDMQEARRAARRPLEQGPESTAKQLRGADGRTVPAPADAPADIPFDEAPDDEGDAQMSKIEDRQESSDLHVGIREDECGRDILAILDGTEQGGTTAVGEIYSPPRVVPVTRRQGLGGGWSLDLKTQDRQGRPWDFDLPEVRQRARDLLRKTRPEILICSPMCTYFSSIMRLAKLGMNADDYQTKLDRAVRHVEFTFELIKLQMNAGRYFLFEHPAYATSWQLECVQEIMARPDVQRVLAHQCRFGLRGVDKIGKALVKKPTYFLTNCPAIARRLDKQCAGGHRHAGTVGVGPMLAGCAVYPPMLCNAIAQGLEQQLRQDGREAAALEAEISRVDCDLPLLAADDPDDDPDVDYEAFDDAKGGSLDVKLVRAARAEEMEFVKERQIYEYASVKECLRRTGRPPVGTKWVDTNKGDDEHPQYRSRLVATEVRKPWSDKWFAATPPLEALRLLVALAARGSSKAKRARRILLLDVSRAHWYPDATREVYIRVPPEDPRSGEPDVCGRLKRSMYGTLDAAQRWADHYTKILVDNGFMKGTASPCHFYHPVRDIALLVHGDDFVAEADDKDLEWTDELLKKHYKCKSSMIGPGCEQEGRILGRIIRYEEWGIQYEPDPVHAETVIRELGLEDARPVVTPMADQARHDDSGNLNERRRAVRSQKDLPLNIPPEPCIPEPESALLDGERLKRYQSVAARVNYLALDRPDIQYAAKELMRKMAAPTENDEVKLKRVGRYLRGRPRLVLRVPWAPSPARLVIFVDSDFAGCASTRKSTSGGAIMWGGVCIKSWAKTQPTIALSSGEAELAAVVRGAAEGLGMISVLQDFGFSVGLHMRSDATAAIGIVGREGLGKVRHLATSDLWIQQRVRRQQLTVEKWPGPKNPADMGTKGLSRDAIDQHVATLGFADASGRAAAAPEMKSGAGRTTT